MNTVQPQNATEGARTLREFFMNLRYLGHSKIEVRGVFTGETCCFSTEVSALPVDLRRFACCFVAQSQNRFASFAKQIQSAVLLGHLPEVRKKVIAASTGRAQIRYRGA